MDIKDQQKYFINTLQPGIRILAWSVVLLFGIGLGQVGSLLALLINGYDLQSLQSLSFMDDVKAIRLMAFANQVFSFMLPAIFLGFIFFRDQWTAFVGLRTNANFPSIKAPSINNTGLAILIMLLSWPLAQFLYLVNLDIPLPDFFIAMEDSTNDLIEGIVGVNSIPELILVLVLVALTPAIGEELMFRGLLQRILAYNGLNKHLAVIVSALVFSAIHMQFQGFLTRFALGLILGYLFVFSGSLWISIIAHFLFNGSQVIIAVIVSALVFSAIHMQFQGFLTRFALGLILGYLFVFSGSLWISIIAHFLFNGSQVIIAYFTKEMMDFSAEPSWSDFSYPIFIGSTLLFIAVGYWFIKSNEKSVSPKKNTHV